jgi:tRNA(Ile)-lysidine synthetase-like protein
MAALDFLSRKHDVTAAFFDHGTPTSAKSLSFLKRYCEKTSINLVDGAVMRSRKKDESVEEYWRSERYKFLDALDAPVVTAHHLDDAVETWVWASMHGQPKLPEIYRNNVIRPFLGTLKQDLVDWCIRKNVPWYEDMSNTDTKYMRNYIRHEAMPVIQKINPGIQKTIKKKLLNKLDSVY